jgi:nucleotide-binding universal stress UspA family protein
MLYNLGLKKILLPTDFSKNSKNAIDYAMALCEKWKCTFYILNVQKQSGFILDDLMAAPVNSSIHNAIADDNKEDLNQFISKLKKQNTNKNYTFESLFDFDTLADSINQVVKAKNIDLIIMGTNGATGAKEVVFGSNTLNTIRKTDCPILTIPENYKFTSIDSILFTTENCEDFNAHGIKPLLDIITTYKSKLNVIDIDFVNYPNSTKSHSSDLKALFGAQAYNYHLIKEVPYPMAINTVTQLFNYNLHSLFIESKSFLERFIYGSVTNEISYNSTLPLLILRK